MSIAERSVKEIYQSVIDDVIRNIEPLFAEHVGANVLQDLKQIWENKVLQSGAITTSTYNISSSENKTVPEKIVFPPQAEGEEPKEVIVQVPTHGQKDLLMKILGENVATSIYTLHSPVIPSPLQDHTALHQLDTSQSKTETVPQTDGIQDSSDEPDEDFVENTSTTVPEEIKNSNDGTPLNSDDDITDEDREVAFQTDNVIVCQYNKINRRSNKWKFLFTSGIMNLDGKDYIFEKANGTADW